MKNKTEIKTEIDRIVVDNAHLLSGGKASLAFNTPRSVMQLWLITCLDALYWVMDEERPRYELDTAPIDT